MARKHKEKYANLGNYTYQLKETASLHNYAIPSWVQSLSFGGLTEPAEEWLQVTKMDKYFIRFHPEKFSFSKEILKKTTNQIFTKIKEVPIDLVKSFCRQRIFVRIKYLNFQNEDLKSEKRKATTISKKVSKKFKKIIN